MLNKQRIIINLIKISMIVVLFDGLIGLDVFINVTSRLGFILTIFWIVKLAIVAPLSLHQTTRLLSSPLFIMLGFIAVINSLRGVLDLQFDNTYFSSIFFYLLIVIGGMAGCTWSSLVNKGIRIDLTPNIINVGVIMLFLICMIYYIFYLLNYISYFGMGVQTYIITAALLSSKDNRLLLLPVMATIMTGKRGLLIVLGAQYSNIIAGWKRRNGRSTRALFILFFILIGYFSYQFDLLVRFQSIFDVSLSDILDHKNAEAFHRLYLATSGRSNEIFAFLDGVSINEIDFWIGYPADFSFNLEDAGTGDVIQHHYFHISPFNYLKHFGIVAGVYLLLVQTRVLIFALKYGGQRKDIGLLLYVGYYFAMFFGAIVMIDILFWVSFSYSFFQHARFRAVGKRQSL